MTEAVSASHREPLILSVVTSFDAGRKRNFYLTNLFQGFTWMLFHFSVVYFFGLLLDNIALVGIFLGLANLVSLFLDIPLGLIQRYVTTKQLLIFAGVSQFIAVGIFFFLIFHFSSLLQYVGGVITPESFSDGIDWFFGSALNWIGVFVAAVCYGLSQEINAVSTYGYVLSNANPSEYSEIFAHNGVMSGIGSVLGLVFSGFVLKLPAGIAVIILGVVIVIFLAFTIRFFNTSQDIIRIEDITAFKASMQKMNAEKVKEYAVSIVKKADLEAVIRVAKEYLFLRPQQKELTEKIPWKTILPETKKEFLLIRNVMLQKPLQISLYWAIILVFIFGFWDTFATSFLISFLDDVMKGWSYLLLGIIVIPGVLLQTYAGKISEKIGVTYVGMFGLLLSGFSLLSLGIVSFFSISPLVVLPLALMNSVGYAAGMCIGQIYFLERYNLLYAREQKLHEIDANAAAGPIRIIGNFANVIGLMLGGLILNIFGYTGFFIAFGTFILAVFAQTFLNREKISE